MSPERRRRLSDRVLFPLFCMFVAAVFIVAGFVEGST